jgi:hypothetical protein
MRCACAALGHRFDAGKELVDILDFACEVLGRSRPLWIACEELAVLFERRTATGGVDQNRIEVALRGEVVHQRRSKSPRFIVAPGVQ